MLISPDHVAKVEYLLVNNYLTKPIHVLRIIFQGFKFSKSMQCSDSYASEIGPFIMGLYYKAGTECLIKPSFFLSITHQVSFVG